ncbi:hypothetical protein [Flavobacterium defluvii]|uniref:Beta-carotene 15,15'-monooxygenase n=1 Tax=Flavobacterium defluvii TaxID=370979 RepID=A0A1M5Q4U6_9FLAO|nr:hypothetical protein [Flavobacterium defluvii]SHH08992.1 hypothetical protein SAMN05443663_105221 [Flavobacterium defluvii]
MKSTLEQIEDIKRDGYSIDFSNVFNDAFENYKKIAVYSGIVMLVLTLVLFLLFTVLGTIFGDLKGWSENLVKILGNQNTSSVEYIILIASITFITALFTPFGAGFLKMAQYADKDQKFDFAAIFSYYKAPYVFPLISTAFILGVVSGSISYFFESVGAGFAGTAFSLFISYFTFFTIPLIVFGNLNVFSAIKSSLILVSKNPITIFGLFIIGYIGSVVGVVICVVGVFFTAVFNTSITYAAYFSIFDDEEKRDPIDSIGRSDLE